MISKVNENQLIFAGSPIDFVTPSGFSVTIRETNGDDEDVVSNVGYHQEGTAMHRLIAGVVLNTTAPNALEGGKVTHREVANWRSRDIYYVLMKIRKHSQGNMVTFEHTFEGRTTPEGFTEDLNLFDFDFSTGNKPAKKGEKDFNPKLPQAYFSDSAYVAGITSSGKKYRFRYVTGEIEKLALLNKGKANPSINDQLRQREFEIELSNGQFQKVDNFAPFSSREMKELRAVLEREDPGYDLITELVSSDRRAREFVSLFMVADFFFPTA